MAGRDEIEAQRFQIAPGGHIRRTLEGFRAQSDEIELSRITDMGQGQAGIEVQGAHVARG